FVLPRKGETRLFQRRQDVTPLGQCQASQIRPRVRRSPSYLHLGGKGTPQLDSFSTLARPRDFRVKRRLYGSLVGLRPDCPLRGPSGQQFSFFRTRLGQGELPE